MASFCLTGQVKTGIISNWLIAAEQDNYLLTTLYHSLIEYWNHNKFRNLGQQKVSAFEYWSNRIINGRSLTISQLWLSPIFKKAIQLYPYMIYHYMFHRLIKKDSRCNAIYQDMPKISADGPHRLQRLGLLAPVTKEGQDLIDHNKVLLFKLNWKISKEEPPIGSHLHYLFNQLS